MSTQVGMSVSESQRVAAGCWGSLALTPTYAVLPAVGAKIEPSPTFLCKQERGRKMLRPSATLPIHPA